MAAADDPAVIKTCIIGGGAAGLVMLKYITKERDFLSSSDVLLLEESLQVGGIWNQRGRDNTDLSKFVSTSFTDVETTTSPVYPNMRTNLPKDIMSFSDFRFPVGAPMFPHCTVVQKYLEDYCDSFNIASYIKLGCRVVRVRRVRCPDTKDERSDAPKLLWEVTSVSSTDGSDDKLSTDLKVHVIHAENLAICTGNYRYPFVPEIKGASHFSGRCLHSSSFRSITQLRNCKKVLIIGGSVSSADVCSSITKAAKQQDINIQVLVSFHHHPPRTPFKYLIAASVQRGAVLKHQLVEITSPGAMLFADGSVEIDIDIIIFATGYRYHFPFFPRSSSETTNNRHNLVVPNEKIVSQENDSNLKLSQEKQLSSSKNTATIRTGYAIMDECHLNNVVSETGVEIFNLYNRVVSVRYPRLFFIGLSYELLSPFLVFEYQAQYVSSLIYHRVSLPNQAAMARSITEQREDILRENANKNYLIARDGLGFNTYKYCNRLAGETKTQGYFSQMLWQRSYWLCTSLMYRYLTTRLIATLIALGGITVALMAIAADLAV